MYCTQKNSKRRRRTCIQLKILCFWSQISAVLHRTQSPRTCLLLYRLSTFTPQRQHYWNWERATLPNHYFRWDIASWNWLLLWLLEIAEDKAYTCCYLLVTANFPATFLVIHNRIRHRYCKRITANTSNNKIISIIQTKGSFLIIERSAFFFLIVLFHRYSSFWELKTNSSTTQLLFLTIGLEINTPLTGAILWIKNRLSATTCHFLQSIGLEISTSQSPTPISTSLFS